MMNRNIKCFDYDIWSKINQNEKAKPKYFLHSNEKKNLTQLIYINSPFKFVSKLKSIFFLAKCAFFN